MLEAGFDSNYQIRRGVVRPILRELIRIGFFLLSKFEITGKENLPKSGPLIVISNHFNFLDPVVLIDALPYPLEFIGGTELPGAPPMVRFIPRMWGTFKVHRGSVSRDAFYNAEGVLQNGGVLGIFPEAGSWASVLRPARPGAALLAARSSAQILPVGLDGVTDVFPLRFGRRAKVRVNIGKPFGPFKEDVRGRAGREKLEEIGHLLMQKIKELIPSHRHGYYADDPTVREAAKGTEIYPWADQVEK